MRVANFEAFLVFLISSKNFSFKNLIQNTSLSVTYRIPPILSEER